MLVALGKADFILSHPETSAFWGRTISKCQPGWGAALKLFLKPRRSRGQQPHVNYAYVPRSPAKCPEHDIVYETPELNSLRKETKIHKVQNPEISNSKYLQQMELCISLWSALCFIHHVTLLTFWQLVYFFLRSMKSHGTHTPCLSLLAWNC